MDDHQDMQGRTVVITGANTGIGLEAAVDLARMGAKVVLTSRDADRGAAAVAEVNRRAGVETAEVVALDLAELRSVRSCAEELLDRLDRIDVLMANAGLVLSERRETPQGFETTFAVNHLGHFLLTDLLLDRLLASAPARIVVTASLAHRFAVGGIDFADLDRTRSYRGEHVYAQTKLANILFTVQLAERLAGTGVTVNACHPGSVRSGFGRDGDLRGFQHLVMQAGRAFLIPPSRGAVPLVHLASSPEVRGVSGAYFTAGFAPLMQRTPSRAARDPRAAEQLWTTSETMLASAGFWPSGIARGR